MAEHLNAEIALHSITDISIAMEWLKATFLYQRVFKNPKHYGKLFSTLNYKNINKINRKKNFIN